MKFSLIPKEEQFFDLLERIAQYLIDSATVLDDLARNYKDVDQTIAKMDGIEHACDEVCHTCLDKLETTFITPFDREDIHSLVLRLDDVVDQTDSAASKLKMFRIGAPRPPVAQFAAIILEEAKLVKQAISKLRSAKEYSNIGTICIEIHRLENQADELIHQSISDLFANEKDAIELIRWKEIYETLETVTDCGEDVANVIHGIVVKNA